MTAEQLLWIYETDHALNMAESHRFFETAAALHEIKLQLLKDFKASPSLHALSLERDVKPRNPIHSPT